MRWSASAIDLMSMCGEAFRRRYIEYDRRTDNKIPNTIGKSVHRSAQTDLEIGMEYGQLLPDAAVPDIAASAFEATWEAETPELDADEKAEGKGVARGKAKDLSIALATLHHDQIAPALKPRAVEKRLSMNHPELRYEIIGYLDVLQDDDEVRDLKTPGKTPKAEDLMGSTQAVLYPELVAANQEEPLKQRRFTIDATVKLKTPKVVTITTEVGSPDHVFQRMYRGEQMIEAGTFIPADPRNWKCSDKYCEYFSDCPWGAARRKSFTLKTNE